MEKIIVQKLHEIEEKEHGKILLAGQWILESEIAGLREKAGKLGEEKKVSWEKLNEIFLKEVKSDKQPFAFPKILKKTKYAGVFMKYYIEDRAVEFAYYIIQNKATVRQTAVAFGVSKSTIHAGVTK